MMKVGSLRLSSIAIHVCLVQGKHSDGADNLWDQLDTIPLAPGEVQLTPLLSTSTCTCTH